MKLNMHVSYRSLWVVPFVVTSAWICAGGTGTVALAQRNDTQALILHFRSWEPDPGDCSQDEVEARVVETLDVWDIGEGQRFVRTEPELDDSPGITISMLGRVFRPSKSGPKPRSGD